MNGSVGRALRPQWLVNLGVALLLCVIGALVLEVLFPWLRGNEARPPLGVVANGVVEGSLYALTAAALVLVYRVSRIVNFAQVAIGSAAGFFITQMVLGYGLPLIPMIPVALVVAFVAGVLAELAMRRFARSPRLLATIVTITLAPAATLVMGGIVSGLNPLPPSLRLQAALRTVPLPFGGFHFGITPLFFNFAHVLTVASAVAGLVAIAMVLRLTRAGRAVRAAADNPEAAGVLGLNTRLIATMVWGLAAVVSGLASVSSLTLHGIDLAGKDGGVTSLLPALAAAMIAGFESIPLAAFAAVWLFVLQQGTLWAFPDASWLEPALLVIGVAALLLRRRALQRRQTAEAGLFESIRAARPTPAVLRNLPGVALWRRATFFVIAAIVCVYPFVVSADQIHSGGTVLLYVMVAISLLVVTGWLGQVNLAPFAFVAIGAVLAGALMTHLHLNFWLALPLSVVVAAGVGIVLGLFALRVQGLWLAPVTLIFAAAVPVLLFSQPYSAALLPAGSITRPPFFVDLSDERSFYYFLLGAALLVVIVAVVFRQSRAGRNVVALRDNEPAALAAGIDPLRSRIIALALAGGIAGLAGVLFAVSEEGVSAAQFGPELSLGVFVMLILGGMGGLSGAVIGAVFGAGILTGPQQLAQFAPLITGVGALMILLLLPGGLSQAVFAVRDSVLRLIAARRHIDVPSLTGAAEPDPAKRRWRLAPSSRGGLGQLPAGRRYSLPSFLWGRSEP